MADFSQYKVISSKLKKRFLLRKPNLSEASESFTLLSRDLSEFKAYSGYCCLAVARCEQGLNNKNGELQALLDAARLFRDSSEFNSAVSAYRHAVKIADSTLLPSVYSELGNMYRQADRFVEAGDTFKEGLLYKQAAESYIKAKVFELGLNCYLKLDANELDNVDLVTIVLLKLCVFDPTRAEISLPVIHCSPYNEELVSLNILLESLFLLIKNGDEDLSVKSALYSHLFPKLNCIQCDLLQFIYEKKL